MAIKIKAVEEGSAAQRAGLRPGMALLCADGHPLHDGLDYEFYTVGARLALQAEDEAGKAFSLVVEKEEYQPLGCVFESYLIDKQHHCKNKCVFCFVDQLPKGLRAPLYFKDDDERLGFLFGNYITLTNLDAREAQRIIDMRFSPVNISVHTANPALRVQMMDNPHAGKALEYIPQFAAAGVEMNFQLVLCPGMNDGAELERSMQWLAGFAPRTASIAVVPVGLTKHRQGLPQLQAYTKESAAAQLDLMLEAGKTFLRDKGTRLVYPSDEWFLLAGREIPPADFYEGYPQLENGVGMWRLFHDEFCDALEEWCPAETQETEAPAQQREEPQGAADADIVVGTLSAPLLQQLAAKLAARCSGAQMRVHVIQNDFFGHSITVTGLLTGRDIIAQLRGKVKSGRLLLPADTLRAEGDMLLDDVTPEEIAAELDVQVEVLPRGGDALLAAVLDEDDGEDMDA